MWIFICIAFFADIVEGEKGVMVEFPVFVVNPDIFVLPGLKVSQDFMVRLNRRGYGLEGTANGYKTRQRKCGEFAACYPILSGGIVMETSVNMTMRNPRWIREMFDDVVACSTELNLPKQSLANHFSYVRLFIRIRM